MTALAALVAGVLLALPARAPVPHFVKRVDVGGYKLALECYGKGTPTIVLDSGFSTPRSAWYWVVPKVQRPTRVCSYDRAGLGQSQPRPDSITPTTAEITAELHTLVERAGLPGPYVLGGWSVGGFDMRYYQHRYPSEVAGLVLVDGTVPSFLLASPDPLDSGVETMFTHAAAEELVFPPALASLPVVDLTHGVGLGDAAQESVWVQGQRQLTSSTTSSIFARARGSGHAIAEDNPALVAYALKLVVKAARRATPLPSCARTRIPKLRGACLAPR